MEEEKEIVETKEMDKENVLKKSRSENKDGDERDKRILERSMFVAFAVALGLALLVDVVLIFLDKSAPTEFWMVLMGGAGVGYTMLGISKVKKHKLFLTIGITASVLFVLFLVLWILELCGIA